MLPCAVYVSSGHRPSSNVWDVIPEVNSRNMVTLNSVSTRRRASLGGCMSRVRVPNSASRMSYNWLNYSTYWTTDGATEELLPYDVSTCQLRTMLTTSIPAWDRASAIRAFQITWLRLPTRLTMRIFCASSSGKISKCAINGAVKRMIVVDK